MRIAAPFEPVDGASLAAFRVLFGCLMLWNTVRYVVEGRIARYWVEPAFHFRYHGFEWVHPLPEAGMYALFALKATCCVGIALGLWYRVSALLFCLAFTYCFLLEQARYLNHYYLICLLGALLVLAPTHRAWSLDARRSGDGSGMAPRWALDLLRAQVGLVYFYAGVAKINPDWLRGEPMRAWLADRADLPVLGALMTAEWSAMAASYGALALDLLAAPLLLWRRTRALTFGAIVVFHLLNALLFRIGVFPWMMIAATTLFFEPGWPRRFLGLPAAADAPPPAPRRAARRAVAAFCALWLLVQVALPLRHWLYPGYVSWTEEGHPFSWHMKLRDKEGRTMFVARDPRTGRLWRIDPADELTDWQMQKLNGRPDLILQYAHHVASRLRAAGVDPVEVRADAVASLNGRPLQRLIDPEVDLAAQPRTLRRARWILPLEP